MRNIDCYLVVNEFIELNFIIYSVGYELERLIAKQVCFKCSHRDINQHMYYYNK